MAESCGEVGVEQTVEEMLAGFASDGKATGHVRARMKASLDRIADGHVFVLDFFADGDALFVVSFSCRACVRKIIVEHDSALVYAERQDEIGVHHAFVGVNHEIWIDPKIEGAALARGRDSCR